MSTFIVGVDTYLDIDEANNLVSNEFTSTSDEALFWESINSDKDKEIIIKQSTALIDKLMFIGIKDSKHGNLSWPRKIDNITFQVPNDLKIAVVLQGIRMNTEDKSESNILRKQGVKKYTTAEASIEYAEDSSIKTVLENGIYKEVFDRYVSRWVY